MKGFRLACSLGLCAQTCKTVNISREDGNALIDGITHHDCLVSDLHCGAEIIINHASDGVIKQGTCAPVRISAGISECLQGQLREECGIVTHGGPAQQSAQVGRHATGNRPGAGDR